MSENQERAFKGVWIPKNIWLSKELKLMEKVFLVEIDSLDNENGCFASNNYFADFFDLSPNRVSEIITSLADKKFVKISYEKKGKLTVKRIIKVLDFSNREMRTLKRGIRKVEDGIREIENGYSEKAKGNNKGFSNSVNKVLPIPKELKEHEKFNRREYGKDELEQYYQDVTK
jgi:Mn-dependent DtxR family transcriptional regulator